MKDLSRGEIFDEASNWIVGGGIVTMALSPLALPGIILVLAAAVPLLAIALAGLLVFGVVAGPVLLMRTIWRLTGHMRGKRRQEPVVPRHRGFSRPLLPFSVGRRAFFFVPAGPIHGAGGPSPKLIGYDPASRG
jgi:hypothetical protein